MPIRSYGCWVLIAMLLHFATGMRQIYGGSRVSTRIPYMVSLREAKDSFTICGGSLIAPTIILTAAHCFDDGATIKWALIGNRRSRARDELIAIKTAIRHPRYNSSNIDYDVMVLILEEASTRQPIKLDRDITLAASSRARYGYAFGWGQMENEQYAEYLRQIRLPLWVNCQCEKTLKEATNAKHQLITSSMICAGGRKRQDTCSGDSGGPLIVQHGDQDILVGMTSWSFACGTKGIPGIYSRIADPHVLGFIDTVVAAISESTRPALSWSLAAALVIALSIY